MKKYQNIKHRQFFQNTMDEAKGGAGILPVPTYNSNLYTVCYCSWVIPVIMQRVRRHGAENNAADCLWNTVLREVSVIFQRNSDEKASAKVDIYWNF